MALGVQPIVPSRISTRLFGHSDGKRRDISKKKRSKFGSYVALTKPRIIELLLITTIPTMVLAAGKWPSVSLMAITLLGGSLAAGGANAINMYIDRDIDALMVRTQGRPLVTGDVSPRNALVFAILLEIAAIAVLWSGANWLSALLALSATMFYVCVYSLWLKRTSKQNIVIGGAAGAVPVLVGWAAVQSSLGWAPVILFVIIFLWTPPHFWALAIRHSDDYRAAGVPMLPVVATMQETVRSMVIYSVVLTVTSLVLVPVANLGYIYGITALLFGTLFILGSIRLGRDPSESRSMRLFSFSITYISVLFMALTIDVLVN